MLKRYVIERDIPGVGGMQRPQLKSASATSNEALSVLAPKVQWEHSYVTQDKTFCIYLADSEERIRMHSEMSGIPVSRITEIPQIIDPLTATN
jgi:hypothetical protein